MRGCGGMPRSRKFTACPIRYRAASCSRPGSSRSVLVADVRVGRGDTGECPGDSVSRVEHVQVVCGGGEPLQPGERFPGSCSHRVCQRRQQCVDLRLGGPGPLGGLAGVLHVTGRGPVLTLAGVLAFLPCPPDVREIVPWADADRLAVEVEGDGRVVLPVKLDGLPDDLIDVRSGQGLKLHDPPAEGPPRRRAGAGGGEVLRVSRAVAAGARTPHRGRR